jgi:hypothetical protein
MEHSSDRHGQPGRPEHPAEFEPSTCDRYWDAISATIDGEFLKSPRAAEAEAHRMHCPTCQSRAHAWSASRRRSLVTAVAADAASADASSFAAAVMQSVRADLGKSTVSPSSATSRTSPVLALRVVLVACAAMQAVAAVAHLFGWGASWATTTHVSNEHAVMELALSVAFFTGARMLTAIAPLVPMTVVAALGLLFTSMIDSSRGVTNAGVESSHLLAIVGAIALLVLYRSTNARSGHMRRGSVTTWQRLVV